MEPSQLSYSPAQAARATGTSTSAVRLYLSDPRYEPWFSDSTRPGKGDPKVLTADDVRLVAFIRQQTQAGATHDDVVGALLAGELETWVWLPDGEEEEPTTEITTSAQAVALAQLLDAFTGTHDRLATLAEEGRQAEQAYQQRINELERKLGEAEGKLAEVDASRSRRPGWIKWFTGG